jgi:HEAT repeat protein
MERLQAICVDSQFDGELLRAVAIGLVLMGDKGVPALLEDEYGDTKSLASQAALLGALARVGDARSVPLLIEIATDEDRTSAARSFALAALGRVSETDELPWSTRLSVGSNYLAGVETLSSLPRGAGILDLSY